MQRLLADFDDLFDLTCKVSNTTLGELLELTISRIDRPSQNWGTEGRRERVSTESGRCVDFYYCPHLFPGMDEKLRLVHELQYRLLPRDLPPGAPVSVSSVLESYCHLSGDLFGWEMLRDGKLLIWITDIAGHGIRAGLASTVLRVLIGHTPWRSQVSLFLSELNRAFHDCIRPEHGSLYATLFAMTLDRGVDMVYGSAGHPPTLVRRADGGIEELVSLDRPIGMFADTSYRSRDLRLEEGDCLLLYTDGVIEATGWDNEAFGHRRLRRLLATKSGGPRELTEAVYKEIASRQDIDKLEDDVTFVAVEL